MGTPSTARRDARRSFLPGYAPFGYGSKDTYYRQEFDKEWQAIQKEYDEGQRDEVEQELTPEERVAILEEQVKQLREVGGL